MKIHNPISALVSAIGTLGNSHPQFIGWSITVASVIGCALLSLTRLPGTEIAGIGLNWFVVWIVVWSLKRSAWSAAIAGLILGLIQDGLTAPDPTHVWPLVVVGVLTARIQKERFVQEEFVSAALIVFLMALMGETVMAIQFSLMDTTQLPRIWSYHPLIALSSAILSSLWTPVLYFPLNRVWRWMDSEAAKSSLHRQIGRPIGRRGR
jgi:rod shape-determining protein MreD